MGNDELMKQFQEKMPPLFAAKMLDKLTGGALCWATLQNMRTARKTGKSGYKNLPPETCFRSDGCRKILIVRDELLRWWLAQLQ